MRFNFSKLLRVFSPCVMLAFGILHCHQRVMVKPDTVATKFLTAYLHGEYETAATLLHPEVLIDAKSTIMNGYSKYKTTQEKQGYISGVGIEKTITEFELLSPTEIYIFLHQNRDKKDLSSFQFRKQSVVKALSVQESKPNSAIVRMKVTPNTGELDLSSECGLELRMIGNEWKVLRDVPELTVPPSVPTPPSTRSQKP